VVTVPLVLLAIPSVIIGFMAIEPMLFGDFFKGVITVDEARHPAMLKLSEAFHGAVAMGTHGFVAVPTWMAVAGVALSYYMYIINPALPAAIKRALQPLHTLLDNKYYLDWINENIIARGARGLGIALWKGGDQALIDGAVVNGSWKVVGTPRRRAARPADRLPLPLRVGHDFGRVPAHDLLRVAQQVREEEKWVC